MNCNLCEINPANQTGSHITSSFLLSTQVGKRGEEKAFLLTTDPNQDYSENRGDEDITEDFLLCRDCENKLSFIENIFSSEISNKIEEDRFSSNFISTAKDSFKYFACNKINPIAFYLFIYSIIWRASISDQSIYSNFELNPDIEEELRFFLDLFLPTVINHRIVLSQSKWEKMVENCQDIFSYFPYYIVKANKLPDKTITYQYFDNISKSPFHIMINEYIILPFFESMDYSDDFFNLKDKLCCCEALNNKYEDGKISIISNEAYIDIINMIQDLAVNERIKNIEEECKKELILKGLPVDKETLKKMIHERVNNIKFDN